MSTALNKKENYHGVAIGFCTYQRLDGLMRLLSHLASMIETLDFVPDIIIVDNDGEDPLIEQSVSDFSEQNNIPIHYHIEKKPGISAARNAVFTQADLLNVRFVAMLDDDEWPSAVWLKELMRKQRETDTVVVGGPVSPVFPDHATNLQKYARYWSVGKQQLNGKPFVFCTCNFLIDMAAISQVPRPLFDEKFGLSGGGDTVFFRGLFFSGHPMAWSDEALVYEEVPDKRASFAWMRQRRFRVGNHAVRWEVLDNGKWRSFAKTLGLSVRLLGYPLFGREPESPLVGWLLEFDKVRGRFASHFGDVFVEYARSSSVCDKR